MRNQSEPQVGEDVSREREAVGCELEPFRMVCLIAVLSRMQARRKEGEVGRHSEPTQKR